MSRKTKDGRVVLTYKEAVARLPKTASIHTFLNPCVDLLVGADWSRKEILAAFKKYRVEESGTEATRMGHGLVFYDGKRHVFVEAQAAP